MSLLFGDPEADCCLHGIGECLESDSICQHRSVWHQLPLLTPYWQTEQPWKSHKEQIAPSSAKAFVASILIACHWKFALSGTLWGIFGPGVGRVFALQRAMLLGYATIHLRIQCAACGWGWRFLTDGKQRHWNGFFLLLTLILWQKIAFFFFQKVRQYKKHGAFFHSFFPRFRGIFSVHSRGIWPNFLVNKMLDWKHVCVSAHK